MATRHTPLHTLARPCHVRTAGRLELYGAHWVLANAHARVPLTLAPEVDLELTEGVLIRVEGRWDGESLRAHAVEPQRVPGGARRRPLDARADRLSLGEAMAARQRMRQGVDAFFAARGFDEVQTPCWVPEPGTDIYIEAFSADFDPGHGAATSRGYLQTSPELAMKRLLVEGFERIYQWTRAWRNGEVTDRHVPEFTILEWYRAWEPMGAIVDDVEALTRALIGPAARVRTMNSSEPDLDIDLSGPFERMTMQEVVQASCGFDLLEALRYDALREACAEHDLIDLARRPDPSAFSTLREPTSPRAASLATHLDEPPGPPPNTPARPNRGALHTPRLYNLAQGADGLPIVQDRRWDDLFFELQVTYIDPWLAERGAVFVTDWPTQLAVLAERDDRDPRVARRFELYVGGVELANGFQELTDPNEQAARFEEDLRRRRAYGLDPLPHPEGFIADLTAGMPPSSGVAVGLDRVLMLATGARTIHEVTPFSLQRDPINGGFSWF